MRSNGRDRRRDLVLANGAAVALLVAALLAGWREAAAFGLGVLLLLDVLVLVRERMGQGKGK